MAESIPDGKMGRPADMFVLVHSAEGRMSAGYLEHGSSRLTQQIIIGGFLAAEPFKSDAAFQESVTSYLRRKDGPSFGAVQRIKYLMSSLMVKHA